MPRLHELTRARRIHGRGLSDGDPRYLVLQRVAGARRGVDELTALIESRFPGLIYRNTAVEALDERGNPIWEEEEFLDEADGLFKKRPVLDGDGNRVPLLIPDPATERVDGVTVAGNAGEAVIALSRPLGDAERRTLLAALDAVPREDVPVEPRALVGNGGGQDDQAPARDTEGRIQHDLDVEDGIVARALEHLLRPSRRHHLNPHPFLFSHEAILPHLPPMRGGAGGGMNLVQYVELLDKGWKVDSGTGTLTGSQRTPLDTGDYDGATYYFEAVGGQEGGIEGVGSIDLLDSSGTEVASVTLPLIGTFDPNNLVRLRSDAFTPTAGDDNYRVRITQSGSCFMTAARIVIVQAAATKTQVSWPMLTGPDDATSTSGNDSSSHVYSLSSATYSWVPRYHPRILIDKSKLDAIVAGDAAWELNATLRASTSGEGNTSFLGLHNVTDAAMVAGFEVSTSSTSMVLVQDTIADSAIGDGDEYEVHKKNTNALVQPSRCDLRVRLDNLANAVSTYRFSRETLQQTGKVEVRPYQRVVYDSSLFDQVDAVYNELLAQTLSGTLHNTYVHDHGTNDSGNTGGANVADSGINVNATAKRWRSGDIKANLDDGDRYIVNADFQASRQYIQSQAILLIESTAVAGPPPAPPVARPRQPAVSGRPVIHAARPDVILESRPGGGPAAVRLLRQLGEQFETAERR